MPMKKLEKGKYEEKKWDDETDLNLCKEEII